MWPFKDYRKLYNAALLELEKERAKKQYWHDRFIALSFKRRSQIGGTNG